MPKGFWSRSTITATKRPLPMLPRCGDCGLLDTCKTPQMKVSGRGRRGILVVGEAPGAEEDRQGVQFVGKTGQRLRRTLIQVGLDPNRDCWFTNALICRPPDNKIPHDRCVEDCRPNLLNTIKDLEPRVILLLGKSAVRSLIGFLWKEDVGDMNRWYGWHIPSQRFNAWVCPTWHPSYIERREDEQKNDRVTTGMWINHIRNAVSLVAKRPWKTVPDFRRDVQRIHDPVLASRVVRKMAQGSRPVAVDYETNMLKPDSPDAKIVCCGVSDGKVTIAYPWLKETAEATKELWLSNVPKIASNMKFEDRWTRALLKTRVKNWGWDTMLAAHVIDNREGITSLKFQAFVLLGQEGYDEHIKPFLESREKGGYSANTVRECSMDDLLLYCGMDAVLEWFVAKRQRKLLC
jgi:uracil-DNA glycosylase